MKITSDESACSLLKICSFSPGPSTLSALGVIVAISMFKTCGKISWYWDKVHCTYKTTDKETVFPRLEFAILVLGVLTLTKLKKKLSLQVNKIYLWGLD